MVSTMFLQTQNFYFKTHIPLTHRPPLDLMVIYFSYDHFASIRLNEAPYLLSSTATLPFFYPGVAGSHDIIHIGFTRNPCCLTSTAIQQHFTYFLLTADGFGGGDSTLPFHHPLSHNSSTSGLVLWEVGERDAIVHRKSQWNAAS